ncbi:hypothetical protein HY638_01080 [Candidatus Woesearchaeota archaeon]|nr:hypothetical protein [Candidatus Woesearchaeota archaeon]
MKLEYRIAKTHVGKGLIETPDVVVQVANPHWSYARHLPADWDLSKIDRRTHVTSDLLTNLENAPEGPEMDLSPLRNDQRASGIVYGSNPIQNMYNLIGEYAQRFPEHEFFGKWGGYQPYKEGKRFVFYVEDENDANLMVQRLNEVSKTMRIPISANHQYGLTQYQDFVEINERLRSTVRNKEGFKQLLGELEGFPHFFHEFFLTNDFSDPQAPSKDSRNSDLI